MVTTLVLGFFCFFFILGHSTLLFFRGKESSTMTIEELIFPWPKSGRVVSVLCLIVSMLFFALLLKMPSDLNSSAASSMWKIFFSTTLVPSAMYALYIFKRIHKKPEGFIFFPSDAKREEWSIPIISMVLISFLSWIFI